MKNGDTEHQAKAIRFLLVYELKGCQKAVEPYLGFLHAVKFGKPSLVCDFMELYRFLADDFLVRYSQSLKKSDFVIQREGFSKNKVGQKKYLNRPMTNDPVRRLYCYFESKVGVSIIMHGIRQTLETLIGEEALLFARLEKLKQLIRE